MQTMGALIFSSLSCIKITPWRFRWLSRDLFGQGQAQSARKSSVEGKGGGYELETHRSGRCASCSPYGSRATACSRIRRAREGDDARPWGTGAAVGNGAEG
jgi:hypothetical protein